MSVGVPIFHITTATAWTDAAEAGSYELSTRGATLAEVGFIHCSFAGQVVMVADALYRDAAEPLVLLQIDPAAVDAVISVENLDGGDEPFPHIYGPIDVSAVIGVYPIARHPSGGFELPVEATTLPGGRPHKIRPGGS